MTENTEDSRNVLDACHKAPRKPRVLYGKLDKGEYQHADKNGGDTLERVADNGDDGRHLTHRAKHVGKACVAAAHVPDVTLAFGENSCHNNSRVDAAD